MRQEPSLMGKEASMRGGMAKWQSTELQEQKTNKNKQWDGGGGAEFIPLLRRDKIKESVI